MSTVVGSRVVKVLLVLLAAWLVIAVLGLVLKGLVWLFLLGCVAFTLTSLAGAAHRRGLVRRR